MAQIRLIPSSSGASNTSYIRVTNPNNMYANTDSTTYADIKNIRNNNTTTYYAYLRGFNFNDVPNDAIVNSFSVKLKAYVSNTATTRPQLYNNTTAINGATATTLTTSVQTLTFTTPSTLTWNTITEYGQNFGIRIPVAKSRNSSGHAYTYGAEILVDYSLPVYHNVSVTNNSEIATVSPSGQQSILEGEDHIITFTGIQDKSEIIVTDNNVDVTNLLTQGGGNTASVDSVAGASYGFSLDGQYYKSQNVGQNGTAALCRLNMSINTPATLKVYFVNYAEATYDYGIIGNIDTALGTSTGTSASESCYWRGNNSEDNTEDEQSVTINIPVGNHFIDFKFSKDNYSEAGNDAFWFRYELSGIDGTGYIYTISNISTDHVIVVNDANVTKYQVTASSTYTGATVSPSSQNVVEGRNATVNIDVNNLYEIKVKDNGVDVTSSVTGTSGNYSYTISNVQTAHTITVEENTNYQITVNNNYTGATGTANPSKVYIGQSSVVSIEVNNLYEIRVKDNNVDVTNSVSAPQPSETTTFIPTSYNSSLSTAITGNTYPPSNGLTNTGSSTYATFSGIQATSAYAYYDFSTTEIPENAVITSVECVARGRISSTSTTSVIATYQLYSGTNPKGSATRLTSTSTANYNLDCGTWTLEELRNAKLCLTIYQLGSTTRYSRFYGANLVVTYYVPASYTITNVQTAHTIVIEQAPTYAISVSSTYTGATITTSQSTVYQGRGATLTLSVNNLYEVVVKDNGTDITSNFTGSNGTYRYGLSNIQTAHTIVVEEAPYYYVDASSTNTGLTAQPSQQKVYAGQSATVTFNGNFNDTTVKDNNNDVTSQLITVNQNTKTYTIQNVSTGHTVVISKRVNYAKVDGVFIEIKKYFIKVNGEWSAMTLTDFVTNNVNDIHMYGGHISGVVTTILGEVVNDSNDTYIEISDNALPSGTYKLIYEDENRHSLQDIDKITEFTIN